VYPQKRIREAADLAGQMDPSAAGKLATLLSDADPAVRYWAATGLTALGDGAKSATDALLKVLRDASPDVRLAAAEALCSLGRCDDALPVLIEGLKHDSEWVRLRAANVLDRIDCKARSALKEMKHASKDPNRDVRKVIGHALEELQAR